jgi:hypothetical protein
LGGTSSKAVAEDIREGLEVRVLYYAVRQCPNSFFLLYTVSKRVKFV